jgi:hypothetical protein
MSSDEEEPVHSARVQAVLDSLLADPHLLDLQAKRDAALLACQTYIGSNPIPHKKYPNVRMAFQHLKTTGRIPVDADMNDSQWHNVAKEEFEASLKEWHEKCTRDDEIQKKMAEKKRLVREFHEVEDKLCEYTDAVLEMLDKIWKEGEGEDVESAVASWTL